MTSLWLDTTRRPESNPFPTDSRWDDVVVGAGLTGMVVAVLLARAGRRVLVLEARRAGEVTTGNTTGKLSLLQGTRLSSVVRDHGLRVAGAYLSGNRAAQEWVLGFCADNQVPVETRDAWSYAGSADGTRRVRHEFQTAQRLDLPVSWTDAEELPYATYGAVRLPDQAQLNPLPLLTVLTDELVRLGGCLVEHQRVGGVRLAGGQATVSTTGGTVIGQQVVLATGVPILDRGLYFAKVQPQRSYALACRVPGPIPRGMYLSVDAPTRSLRTAYHGEGDLLVVGGNGHPVGRPPRPTHELVEDLAAWTGGNFPQAEVTHSWSAQDYRSANSVPFVGRLPRGRGRIHLATGFGKWGMTNGPMAALMIAGDILDDPPPWARTLSTRITRPAGLLTGLGFNAEVGAAGLRGWLAAELRTGISPAHVPPEGSGVVGARNGRPVAVSTVGGRTCELSAVCTHLGGVVRWDDHEQSWDCPLHGSRFSADGQVLEGPATQPLAGTHRG